MLLCLVGLTGAGAAFAKSDDVNKSAGVATVVLVWLYLGSFNGTNPVLFSYPAEVQTYSMRSKGMLLWNTVTQLEYTYVVFVDAVALNAIGYKYYIVYMPLVVIQWVLTYFYMVETRGYTLEEIANAFDGSTTSLVPHLRRDAEAALAREEEEEQQLGQTADDKVKEREATY